MFKYTIKFFVVFVFQYLTITAMENSNQLLKCNEHKKKNIKKVHIDYLRENTLEELKDSFTLKTLSICQKIVEKYVESRHKNQNLVLIFYNNKQQVFHFDVDANELCCNQVNNND